MPEMTEEEKKVIDRAVLIISCIVLDDGKCIKGSKIFNVAGYSVNITAEIIATPLVDNLTLDLFDDKE